MLLIPPNRVEMRTKTQCSVFVVDKDTHLRNLLSEFLSDLGCEWRFFDDGYSALDAARLNPPALIITEILVPRLDGLSLCRLIKGDSSLAAVKVLVLSILSGEERARQSCADGFLTKPIQRTSILQAVRALIGTHADPINHERPD